MVVLFVGNGYFLAILAAVIIAVVCVRFKIPHFAIVLFAVSFIVRALLAIFIHTPLESDFMLMYQASEMLKNGDTSFNQWFYFQLWGYQTGFVAWQALLLKIVDNQFFIKLVNCALCAGINVMIYQIARQAADEKAARIVAGLYLIFLFPATFVSVLTNQHASAFFLVLGVYLATGGCFQRLGIWRFALAGLSLCIGNIIRPEGIIFLVALIAYVILQIFTEKKVLAWLARAATLFGVYFLFGALASFLVSVSGLNPNGLSNSNPMWKFVAGLNPDSNGMYSSYDWNWIASKMPDLEITPEAIEVEKRMIEERLNQPPDQLLKLAGNKIYYFWGAPALQWSLGHWVEKDLDVQIGPWTFSRQTVFRVAEQFDRGMFYLLFGLALVGVFYIWRRRLKTEAYLPPLILFASLCCFLLIEIQPRYAYLPQIFVFITGAYGISALLKGEKNHEEDIGGRALLQ